VGPQSRLGSFLEDKNFLPLTGSVQHVAQSLYINLSVCVERKIVVCVKKSLLCGPTFCVTEDKCGSASCRIQTHCWRYVRARLVTGP